MFNMKFLIIIITLIIQTNLTFPDITENIMISTDVSPSINQMTIETQVMITTNKLIIDTPTQNEQVDDFDIIITIDGMVCAFCAQGISKSLEKKRAVKEVVVNLENRSISLKIKRFRSLSDEIITEVIEDAGYSIKKISRQN